MTALRGLWPNLGYKVCDQTVGNVEQRHGLPPAPERKRTTTWPAFIRTHLALLAGTDFFTAEVLTLRGLVTYYVLFFIHLDSRWVDIAGITVDPDEPWMKQIARNATMEGYGILRDCRYLLHDRDAKYPPRPTACSMPRAIGWAPALLSPRSRVIVRQRPNSEHRLRALRSGDRGGAEDAFPVVPPLAPQQA